MKATIFSIILGIILWFIPLQGNLSEGLMLPLLLIPIILLAIQLLTYALYMSPLQKAEQDITPRLLEMLSRDKKLRLTTLTLIFFPIVSMFLVILLQHSPDIKAELTLISWMILFGVALDALIYFVRRVSRYLNPFKAIEIISTNAKNEIQQNRPDLFIDSIDALSEVTLRAIDRSNTSLAQQSIGELREVGSAFLNASKSFANLSQDLQSIEHTHVDKVSFTLFSLLSRLEMIGVKGADKHYEPIVSQALTALGRIAISAAHYDLSLVTYPILSIGKTATLAERKNLHESAVKGEIVLVQVAKTLINKNELAYFDIKSPFLTLIDNLDQIEKERFKQNKDINVKVLMQPFLELQSLFRESKVAEHQDTPVILTELDRVLAEFNALQSVMVSMPLIPPMPEEVG